MIRWLVKSGDTRRIVRADTYEDAVRVFLRLAEPGESVARFISASDLDPTETPTRHKRRARWTVADLHFEAGSDDYFRVKPVPEDVLIANGIPRAEAERHAEGMVRG